MDRQLSELARLMEEHERAVWTTCVEACSSIPGNPLQAVVDHAGTLPLVALCAVDRADINRVIGLGVRSPVDPEDLAAVCSFYERHDQRHYRVEVTPLAAASEVPRWMADHGLSAEALGTYKIWRPSASPPAHPPGVEVRELGPSDAEALSALNISAWGAWSMPVSMAGWFGATLGADGVHHYGVVDGDRLVATGALFLGDGLGWLGFDATHPRHQGRKLRQAISSVRMAAAHAHGCRLVHAESAVAPSRRVLRDGWHLLYEKASYSTVRLEKALTAGGRTAIRPFGTAASSDGP